MIGTLYSYISTTQSMGLRVRSNPVPLTSPLASQLSDFVSLWNAAAFQKKKNNEKLTKQKNFTNSIYYMIRRRERTSVQRSFVLDGSR